MPRGAAKSAELRRIAAGDEPLLFGSLYTLPKSDSTPVDSPAQSGTALARARSFIARILSTTRRCVDRPATNGAQVTEECTKKT